jgi:Tol biopolymer transport system component
VSRTLAACLGVCALIIAVFAAPSTATFAGKNGRISFSRVVGNHVEIFSANPNGGHVHQLTTSKPRHAVSFISDWSPDGQTIAFDSDRTDIDGRKHPIQIYLMRADGANVTQLTRGPGFHGEPGWSPSGSTLAIDADWGKHSLNGIWVIPAFDANGVTVAEARRVTDTPKGPHAFDGEPQFSPDGTTIAFTRFKSARRSAIFRVNLDGSGLERLTTYRRNASDPDFSPDGRWITFDTGDSGRPGAKGNIYLMHPDGSHKTALTDLPRFHEGDPFELAQNPVFSPNGRRILYTQFHDESTDLVVMHANGSGKRVILGGRRFPNKADWGTYKSG